MHGESAQVVIVFAPLCFPKLYNSLIAKIIMKAGAKLHFVACSHLNLVLERIAVNSEIHVVITKMVVHLDAMQRQKAQSYHKETSRKK
jgi:hypothetical protein